MGLRPRHHTQRNAAFQRSGKWRIASSRIRHSPMVEMKLAASLSWHLCKLCFLSHGGLFIPGLGWCRFVGGALHCMAHERCIYAEGYLKAFATKVPCWLVLVLIRDEPMKHVRDVMVAFDSACVLLLLSGIRAFNCQILASTLATPRVHRLHSQNPNHPRRARPNQKSNRSS